MARLSQREKQIYQQGGFRLEGRRPSRAATERAELRAAARILRRWGAGPSAIRQTLALPSSTAIRQWHRGRTAIPVATTERVAVVIAIYRCFVEANDFAGSKPLPPLRPAGRPALTASDVLAGGRLSDLLGLWRQLVLAEEAVSRRRTRG